MGIGLPDVMASPTGTEPTISMGIVIIYVGVASFILMAEFFYLVLMYIFGRPIFIAKAASTSNETIVEHFDTNKSGVFKLANIEGGSFRHKEVRDGTLIAVPEAVNSLYGLRMVLSSSLLGVTIPTKILAAMSILHSSGITNFNEIQSFFKNEETGGIKNVPILSGYSFNNFNELLKEVKVPKFIPMSVDVVHNYVRKNINCQYTEMEINLGVQKFINVIPDNGNKTLLYTGIAILISVIALTMVH